MLNPKITGAIITVFIVIVGVLLLYPTFKQGPIARDQVLLTFNIINSTNLPIWCNDLSKYLQDNKIHSTVFITGIMADNYPECVTSFSKSNDIGSMTYSYNNLAPASNYTDQLSQIQQGKTAVDKQGNLNSTIFRAPHGQVDQNIYSLLTRSHILADFSYNEHFNIYTNGLSGKIFYRYPMTSIGNISYSKLSDRDPKIPLMVNIYNYDSIKKVQEFINTTSKNPHQFVTASELIRNTVR